MLTFYVFSVVHVDVLCLFYLSVFNFTVLSLFYVSISMFHLFVTAGGVLSMPSVSDVTTVMFR